MSYKKIRDNLSSLSVRASMLTERRICELYDLSELAAEEWQAGQRLGLGVFDAMAILSEKLEEGERSIHGAAMPDNVRALKRYAEGTSALDRAVFCELLLKALAKRGIVLTESDFLESEDTIERIVYVKNQYADEAFDVFSQDMSNPTYAYASGIKAAVESLERGDAGYCLLPLEENDSRISTVLETIYKRDYKINSVTPVFGFDGTANMKYALVSKGFSISAVRAEDDRYLELRIPAEPTDLLRAILEATGYLEARLYRLSTVSIDGTADQYSLILERDGRDFVDVLTYLTLFTEDYIPVGIYKNIE